MKYYTHENYKWEIFELLVMWKKMPKTERDRELLTVLIMAAKYNFVRITRSRSSCEPNQIIFLQLNIMADWLFLEAQEFCFVARSQNSGPIVYNGAVFLNSIQFHGLIRNKLTNQVFSSNFHLFYFTSFPLSKQSKCKHSNF